MDRSGKASNKSEKTEESDEKKLETITTESEWVFLEFNIVTDGGSVNVGLGRSGQESRQSRSLLSLKHGKTIFVEEFLVLYKTSLGCLLVVEVWDWFRVDGGVNEDGGDDLVASSIDFSEFEVLGFISERGVSLASRWGLLLKQNGTKFSQRDFTNRTNPFDNIGREDNVS